MGRCFRYEKIELKGASAFITVPNGDPLVTVNKIGKGSVVFVAVPDLLGMMNGLRLSRRTCSRMSLRMRRR